MLSALMGTGDRGLTLFGGSCLVVAEVAQAHDGSLGTAHAYVDAAAAAGAGAVKFQTHIARAESTPDEPWRVRFSPQDDTRFDYWKRMEFTEDQWMGLRKHAHEKDLVFISSPFSIEAVELLERVDVDLYKIASGEISNIPLLEGIASTGKPVIVSSGMSPWSEIDMAVDLFRDAGSPAAVLQCTSEYPCPPELVGLNVIGELRERYGIPVGMSDHSGTIFAGLAAATLGIDILEVHVTLSREMFGPDVPASITTEELSILVSGIRFIERATGNPVDKEGLSSQFESLRRTFMKSIVAARDLPAGTVLTLGDLALKKPATGIPPDQLTSVVGSRLTRALSADEQVGINDLGKGLMT